MSRLKKISHVIYWCTHHIMWTLKYRFRLLEALVKELLTKDIRMLAEGNLLYSIHIKTRIYIKNILFLYLSSFSTYD